MARFHFNSRPSAVGNHRRRIELQRSLEALCPSAEVAEPEVPRGPGWFDSSWDLVRGLEVREGLPGDAQLHEWLEAWLRSDRVAPAPPAVATRCDVLDLAQFAGPADAADAFGIEGLELA